MRRRPIPYLKFLYIWIFRFVSLGQLSLLAMSCFGLCQSKRSLPSITKSRRQHWTKIGPAKTHLYESIKELYWVGVDQELENIIRTLSTWQKDSNSHVNIEDEDDNHIHGYDTFLDQVSKEARNLAAQYAEQKAKEAAENPESPAAVSERGELSPELKKLAEELDASSHRTDLKAAVEKRISSLPILSGIEKRAGMLLQAAGFLDIDKLIEYRPPLEDLGFWAGPAIPQLTLRETNSSLPEFAPLRCHQCTGIIRGSMFAQGAGNAQHCICEDCYRKNCYGKPRYKKIYKHCILPEAITPEVSREMCECPTVPSADRDGQERSLFPVKTGEKHEEEGDARCKILNLGNDIALAKYNGLVTGVSEQQNRAKPSRVRSLFDKLIIDKSASLSEARESSKPEKQPFDFPKHGTQSYSNEGKVPATEAGADEDVPLFFRQFTRQYPFGNVHMGLRIGPLVLENGVQHTKGGALISLREYPVFHDRLDVGERQPSLAVSEGEVRHVWRQNRLVGKPKRYKAIMKQVVGAPFTGLLSGSPKSKTELEIIQLLVERSRIPFDDPGVSHAERESALKESLKRVTKELKELIEDKVNVYLHSIVERLLDPNITLTWSWSSNNCQSFCNNLIDNALFGSMVSVANLSGKNTLHSTPNPTNGPLYLMSFVCPYEGYLRNKIATKYDVPHGLTEEYLFKFHFGLHDDADIIDTLQEYWFDWGAFGAPLYKNQELFPWDCTEAFQRGPTKCNDCNLAKHVLAFPFDSWSIAELHLHRDPHMYPPTDTSWMQNRLKVLTALSFLSRATVGMAKARKFRATTKWLNFESNHPWTKDPSKLRVKLGGIHRAQPFSHSYEAGKYCRYFIAGWAVRERLQQIKDYESLRDWRMGGVDYDGGKFGQSTSGDEMYNYLIWGFDCGGYGGNDHLSPNPPEHGDSQPGSTFTDHPSPEDPDTSSPDHGDNKRTHEAHQPSHLSHSGTTDSTGNRHDPAHSPEPSNHDSVSKAHQITDHNPPRHNKNHGPYPSADSTVPDTFSSHNPALNTNSSSSYHGYLSPYSYSRAGGRSSYTGDSSSHTAGSSSYTVRGSSYTAIGSSHTGVSSSHTGVSSSRTGGGSSHTAGGLF